jgi:hypothetical protein
MSATMIPTKNTVMKMAQVKPHMAISGIPTHPRMSPNLPHGSPGTDMVPVFCAHLEKSVNATNVQGVR